MREGDSREKEPTRLTTIWLLILMNFPAMAITPQTRLSQAQTPRNKTPTPNSDLDHLTPRRWSSEGLVSRKRTATLTRTTFAAESDAQRSRMGEMKALLMKL